MPFDIDGVEFSHRGELCSFDTFLDRFGLEDAALRHVARIVRGADTARLDLEPEAAGLLAMALGLSAVYVDDHAALAAGMALYDGLYGWARFARGETHNWPAQPVRTLSLEPGMASTTTQAPGSAEGAAVSFAEAWRTWLKIGLLGFGGPAGQIALMHRILVDEKRWVSEARFLHALNYCMLLPGPEAQQLATYVGWLLHRTLGGVVAGTLFVLPGFVVIVTLSTIYALFQDTPALETLFFGLKAAVLAVVIEAVLRVGKRALKNRAMVALAAVAFVAIFALGVPFPLIVLGAGLIGLIGARLRPDLFAPPAHGPAGGVETALERQMAHSEPSLARAARVIVVWGALWAALPLLLLAIFGTASVYATIAVFFSKMAVVTFGGAYAVLAYVAQQAVETLGWLQPGEMLDGLAMAETTPGPLILVLTYVGFLASFRAADRPRPADRRLPRRRADHLGHLHPLLPVDLPGRALHRDPARQPPARRRAVRRSPRRSSA